MELKDSTFIELFLLLTNRDFGIETAAKVEDPILQRFWRDFPKGWEARMEYTSSTLNKISPFITDRAIRNIIGQPENTVNLKKVMNEGKILFINLSKGDVGEENSALLGAVIVNQVLIAALQRRGKAYSERLPFHLVVDEFQNFITESFAVLQSEARKYAVDVTIAHQFRDQLDFRHKGSTLNVGNMIVFRVTGRDGYEVASQFDNTPPPPDTRVEPVYRGYEYQGNEFLIETKLNTAEGKLYQDVELPRRPYSDVEAEMANRLSTLPNYQAWCRLIYDPRSRGKKGAPRLAEHHFETEIYKPLGKDGKERTEAEKKRIAEMIKANSSELGKPKDEVEADIKRRTLGLIEEDEPIPASEERKSTKG